MKRLLFVFLLISPSVWAGLYPVITSIKTINLGYAGGIYEWNYYVTQKLLEIGPAADLVPPAGRYVAFSHKHYDEPGAIPNSGAPVASRMTNGKDTVGQIAIALYNETGKYSTYVYHSAYSPVYQPDECVGYFLLVGSDYKEPWGSVKTPGGCIAVPPADEWCKIITPEILLDHGVVTLKDAEGSSASATMKLRCTTPTAVKFNLITSEKYVYLDEGKAEIQINNLPLKTKVNLPSGDSSLPIKDLLTGVNSEGYHTGSSVLVMMPY